MKEMIIVAGKNSLDVVWLRQHLKDEGYSSVPCETAEEIIEELNILPGCGVRVSLVVIDSDTLKKINDDLVTRLSNCAPEVPFITLSEPSLPETFERICVRRAKFERDGNPLARLLEEAGFKA